LCCDLTFTGQALVIRYHTQILDSTTIQNLDSRWKMTQCAKINQPMRLLVSDPTLSKHKKKHSINYSTENQKRSMEYQSALFVFYIATDIP
jgi:hypothetical protein